MQVFPLLWLPLCLALGAGSFGAGGENAENVTGILGKSITFQLTFFEPFKTITWQRKSKNDFDAIGFLTPEQKCSTTIVIESWQGRLNVSDDCKKIEILHLQQEDSATFKAQIQIPKKKDPLNFLFHLQVFRYLLDSDLQIHCKAIGNETWQLSCSARESEEGVTFRMAADGQKEHSGRTLEVHDGRGKEENRNISCIATNPISNASSSQLLRDLCEPHATAATMAPPSQNGNGGIRNIIVGVVLFTFLIVIAVCVIVFYCRGRRKKDASNFPGSSAEPEECKSIYAQVGEVFQDQDAQSSRPRTGPKKKKQQASQTIYTTVEHPPKTSPLQTDDEKMQKWRRRGEEAEKTVYSEITKPSESEAQSLKTVYETLKNPQPAKTQEYNQII